MQRASGEKQDYGETMWPAASGQWSEFFLLATGHRPLATPFTSIPSSAIFFLRVLRLIPSTCAAFTWLPAVARRVISINGFSTRGRIRAYNPGGGWPP